jgi:hypothetical protein
MQGSRNYVYSRQYVAGMLRRKGFPELADLALRELPIQWMPNSSRPEACGTASARTT